jgi:hypothetical protein
VLGVVEEEFQLFARLAHCHTEAFGKFGCNPSVAPREDAQHRAMELTQPRRIQFGHP